MNEDELRWHLKFLQSGMVVMFGYLLAIMGFVLSENSGGTVLVVASFVGALSAVSMGIGMNSEGYNRRFWNTVGLEIPPEYGEKA